jgi:predicted ATP-grasp superfamily ATP-dependent carboligase
MNPALPPVVVLGGSVNALSVARSLGKRGVTVYLSIEAGRHAMYSRYCARAFPFRHSREAASHWAELLLGRDSHRLHGSVVFACNDEAVTFIANHRPELAEHYLLDDSIPRLQLAMLDKLQTLTLAQQADVGAPRFWQMSGPDDLDAVGEDLPYPLIVKPLLSHLFQARFGGRKFLRVHDRDQTRAALTQVQEAGLQAMLSEWIPGPDDRLSSYYTYIDASDRPLFHFTKRVIRRFPKNEGLTSYHLTDWNPEVAELGLRFLTAIGFRGLANVEFKRDVRDGRLKIVECNARFTAPQELFVRCGLDTASLIYDHIVGLPLPEKLSYRSGVRLWYPVRDFLAYRQLSALNELTLFEWLKSVCHWQALPFFHPTDPLPTIVPALQGVRRHFVGLRGLKPQASRS